MRDRSNWELMRAELSSAVLFLDVPVKFIFNPPDGGTCPKFTTGFEMGYTAMLGKPLSRPIVESLKFA